MSIFNSVQLGVKDAKFHSLFKSTFIATNPTPGTGIATKDAAIANVATYALMNIYNAATEANGNWIRPLSLLVRATAVNTTASDFQFTIYRDVVNRYDSGGSAIAEVSAFGAQKPSGSLPTSKAIIHFGEVALDAADTAVLLYHEIVSITLLAIGDGFLLIFDDGPANVYNEDMNEAGSFYCGNMGIAPGHNLSIHAYGTAQAASPDFEFQFRYLEYPNQNG